ncbi:zinc ABC transporter substrate-binding protein, partial [archaeon]|nr:zinc ABC transporter substrate-binding protein [archaeon]
AAAVKLAVFVSILPQKYFVQQIGRELVEVQVMVQPGASPATFEPSPGQMAAIAGANIYFSIGVPFEKIWLPKITASNPGMKIVPTDHGVPKMAMTDHLHGEETHPRPSGREPAGKYQPDKNHADESSQDPHIWLSPPLVAIQAQTILLALQELDPDNRSIFEANYNDFISEIQVLNAELQTIFSARQGLKFLVFHPAWGYFAQAYGLKQIPVEVEGKSPKPARLIELIKLARKTGIRVIFAQPQFSAKSAEVIARGIGGQVVLADPLAEDWPLNLRTVARKIEAALRE